MSHKENTDKFISTILASLDSTNLDPVIDYSEADKAAQELIDQTFNADNQGKEVSTILSSSNESDYTIYNKSGIFDHGIQDGELSTSKIGRNAIEFCKSLIHFVREQLNDLDKQAVFLPIALKWHVGVAVFVLDTNNDGSSIIVSEPSYSQWNDMQKKHLDEEWKEWGVAEYSNKDDFVNEYDWTDAEVFLRDTWQAEEINKITALLKIKSTLTNVNIKTEEMLSGEEEGEAEEGDEGLEDKIDSLADELEDLKAEFEKLLNDEEDEAGDDAEEIEK
ncbi:hypothetical protein N9D94_03885 [Gammaproteobacteria bacterium]|nr:hypothetical protein [Gammaproteobacteria bacterium]